MISCGYLRFTFSIFSNNNMINASMIHVNNTIVISKKSGKTKYVQAAHNTIYKHDGRPLAHSEEHTSFLFLAYLAKT